MTETLATPLAETGEVTPGTPGLRRALGLRDLVLFNLVAILSLRWLNTAAKSGPSAVTLWVLAALLFFVPIGLAVAQLSARYPSEGGIYAWTKQRFGTPQTGWLNPFAFARAVRTFFKGPLVLAGGISDGRALRAAEVLGCELAYMGTKFIATVESLADPKYKQMLVDSTADDITLTRAFTGLQTNMLRPSIVAAGLDPDALPERNPINVAKDIDVIARDQEPKRWRDIWSAGHSTSGVDKIATVADLIAQISLEYRGTCAV